MIEFAKCREVKSPKRNKGDAGIDFFIPEYTQELVDYIIAFNPEFFEDGGKISQKEVILPAGVDVIIPTGLKYKIPEGRCLVQFTKSGVGKKLKIDCNNGVGDEIYQGELHMHAHNYGKRTRVLEFGQKLTQFVPLIYDNSELQVHESDKDFFTEKTVRGSGGFGSTGIK